MVFTQSRWRSRWYLLICSTATSHLMILPTSYAMTETAYKAALQIAEKKVLTHQARIQARAQSLTSNTANEVFGRPYQIGDNWDVASWQFKANAMRKTSESDKTSNHLSNGGIFHYEVVQSEPGSPNRVKFKITQTQSNGFKPVDSRIESLTLSVDGSLSQSHKNYQVRGLSESLSVSPEGIHSGMTPLELYPLDVPDISTASKTKPTQLPHLPPQVQDVANKLGYKVDLNRSQWFEQDDFFGRAIQILWQEGDPWPAYLKTSGGISILIHKGDL